MRSLSQEREPGLQEPLLLSQLSQSQPARRDVKSLVVLCLRCCWLSVIVRQHNFLSAFRAKVVAAVVAVALTKISSEIQRG